MVKDKTSALNSAPILLKALCLGTYRITRAPVSPQGS